jgi:hypothetical protein
MASLEQMPLAFGGWLALKPLLLSSFLLMTQSKTGASHIGGRLFKSAASSALALSALAGAMVLAGGEANAAPCPGSPIVGTLYTDTCDIVSETYAANSQFIGIGPGTNYDWVTLDVDNAGGPFTGTGIYTIEKTGGWYDKVQLRAEAPLNGAPWSVTKTICDAAFDTGGDCTGTVLGTLVVDQNTMGGMDMIALPNTYSTLYIKDVVAGNGTPHFNNDFHNVPGPLPILGAGAAFGFSRKLRGRIKASRTV